MASWLHYCIMYNGFCLQIFLFMLQHYDIRHSGRKHIGGLQGSRVFCLDSFLVLIHFTDKIMIMLCIVV